MRNFLNQLKCSKANTHTTSKVRLSASGYARCIRCGLSKLFGQHVEPGADLIPVHIAILQSPRIITGRLVPTPTVKHALIVKSEYLAIRHFVFNYVLGVTQDLDKLLIGAVHLMGIINRETQPAKALGFVYCCG